MDHTPPLDHTRRGAARTRRRGMFTAAALAMASAGAVVGASGAVSAASTTNTADFGSTTLTGAEQLFVTGVASCSITCIDSPTHHVEGQMAGTIVIGQRSTTDITTEVDGVVRQGSTLDLSHQLQGTTVYTARIQYQARASLFDDGLLAAGEIDSEQSSSIVDIDVPCSPAPSGALTCSTATTIVGDLMSLTDPGLLSAVDLLVTPIAAVQISFQVADGSVQFVRVLEIGSATDERALTVATRNVVPDPVSVPCSAPVGDIARVRYDQITSSAQADVAATTDLSLNVGGINGNGQLISEQQSFSTSVSGTRHAVDVVVDLGTVGRDNVPPDAVTAASVSGLEGSAISFDGRATTDNCGIDALTMRWDFSDGGVAFGPQATHVFADDGLYTGMLTVTDPAGNQDTASFTVTVGNRTPVADAGPDGSGRWGRAITFTGSGTDPGSADQSTLSYAWDFGDGTPSATGGASTTHAYSTPGTYQATFTVCDDGNACSSDVRQVVVSARQVTVAYTGPSAGTSGTPTSVSASLVDEFGEPVAGRTVSITVGTDPALSATTDGSGTATANYTPSLAAGTHPVAVTFAGDTRYTAASAAGSFTVGPKATSTVYTGAVTGSPNKVITLSATLTDASGTPLAGRTVSFTLGSQSATAVTNATGQATTTLKLAQKNGTYTVITTFSPTGSDATRLSGSGDSDTFKLQAK